MQKKYDFSEKKLTAGIYARYSPGRDRDQSSTIEAQVAMCTQKAHAGGLTIDEAHIYIDRAISGATIQRDAFGRMLKNIEAGDFPPVLIAKDDKRLFRNEREAGELIEWIWSQDVEIRYCLIEFGDPRKSDEQWFLQRQFHLFAELERRRKAKEVHEHQRQNAIAGYSNGGLPPYGYRRKEVEVIDEAGVKKTKLTWEIDEHEAEAVRIAYELHLNGVGIKAIAYALTERGYQSRRGAPMNKATVGEWFRNPYPHAGCIVWNTRDRKLHPKPREQWVVAEGAYPAIISMDVAERVYAKSLARRAGKMAKKQSGYLLSGLMTCGVCGSAFIMNSTPKRGDAFYVCGQRQRRRDSCENKLMLHRGQVEGQITHWLKETILEESFLKAYFARVAEERKKHLGQQDKSVRQLETKLARVEARIERLIEAIADGSLPVDTVKRKIADEQAQQRAIQAQLRAARATPPALPDLPTFRSEMSHALDEEETKKVALRSLVKSITVLPDATLRIECAIQTCFQPIALHPIEPKTGYSTHFYKYRPPKRGGLRQRR